MLPPKNSVFLTGAAVPRGLGAPSDTEPNELPLIGVVCPNAGLVRAVVGPVLLCNPKGLGLDYDASNSDGTPSGEKPNEATVRGETGKSCAEVTLHYRAIVKHSTGENWTNSELILSSARPDTRTKSLPTLRQVRIQESLSCQHCFSICLFLLPTNLQI